MKFVHGDVTLEVEDNWVDASQIAFMAPPDRSLAEEFAKQAAAAGAPVHLEMPGDPKSRANFQLAFRPYMFAEMPHKEFCESELKAMTAQIPGAKSGELEWIEASGAEAAVMDVEINMEGLAAMQFHALVVVGKRLFHFCGSAGRGDYAKARPNFVKTLQSLDVGDRVPVTAADLEPADA